MPSLTPPGPDAARVELRPATRDDRGFGERLYLDTMRPLLSVLEALSTWREADEVAAASSVSAVGQAGRATPVTSRQVWKARSRAARCSLAVRQWRRSWKRLWIWPWLERNCWACRGD